MSFLFLLASLGVINGYLVSIYLIIRKKSSLSERYFAGLLFSLSTRIGKSVYYYFDHDADRLILQIGLSACIFIGPFFFLYFKSLYRQTKNITADAVLLLALLVLIVTIGGIYPYRSYPQVWNDYIVYGIYVVWLVFLAGGLFYAFRLLSPGELLSFWKLRKNQQYLFLVVFGMIFITMTYQIALFVGFTYIWGALIFSLTFYFIGFRVLLQGKSLTPKFQNTYDTASHVLMTQIDQVMKDLKLYRDHSLKLDALANRLRVNRQEVSKVLNEHFEGGYAAYVRNLRVEEAKRLINTRPELTLEGIGLEAGFKAKSSFFEAFKKVTGMTPSTYKRHLTA